MDTPLLAMRALLDDPLFSDVTFLVEGQSVRAHRVLLSARCPAFRAMFTSGMAESGSDATIEIKCTIKAFRALLVYLYSDAVTCTDAQELADLLVLADHYLLADLKLHCDRQLALARTVESDAIGMFLFAQLHNAQLLKRACMEYILRNVDAIDLTPLDKNGLTELLVYSCSRNLWSRLCMWQRTETLADCLEPRRRLEILFWWVEYLTPRLFPGLLTTDHEAACYGHPLQAIIPR